MKNMTLILLAATAIGALSIGAASALPINTVSAGSGASLVQDVRIVCDQYGQCYNTRRSDRVERRYHAPRYNGEAGYYVAPSGPYMARDHGYYDGPRVGIGIGPFGVETW